MLFGMLSRPMWLLFPEVLALEQDGAFRCCPLGTRILACVCPGICPAWQVCGMVLHLDPVLWPFMEV